MTQPDATTRILLVEDDDDFRETLAEMLVRHGFEVLRAGDGASAIRLTPGADLLITDVRLPDTSGIDLMGKIREARPALPVLVMTGYGTIKDAVEAMRKGASTYLTKPFEPEEMLLHLRQVEEVIRLRKAASRAGRGDLVGTGRAMREAYGAIDMAAASQAPVLITGETGTGKELAARAIHSLSERARKPFLAVNLGALPGELAESELFGHERGAFTGASARKAGRFRLAGEGTLLLDEIGTLPLPLQPKLLRVIETREYWPVGSDRPLPLRARILAATNADLQARVKGGSFREDLYYRLDVLRVHMPPLRDHPADIPPIAIALLDRMRAEVSSPEPAPLLGSEALAVLVTHPWPGNVRELSNALQKAWEKVRSRGDTLPRIGSKDLGLAGSAPALDLPFREGRIQAAEEWSRRAIAASLAACGGNVTHAAERMQMNTSALFRLIKKYGLKS
jgi:DNA-binding NtrC family response regulator